MTGVSPIDRHDSPGGTAVFHASLGFYRFPARCLAERTLRAECVDATTATIVEIVRLENGQCDLPLRLGRRMVERIVDLVRPCRRLTRDYEATVIPVLAFLMLGAAMILVRHLILPS